MTSATMFYYTQVMQNLFGGYKEVNQVTDFWNVSVNAKCSVSKVVLKVATMF